MGMIKSVAVVGGGPSGLYFALLMKKRFPQVAVDVYEQNAPDATYGFGIILADRGLRKLHLADAESHDAIQSALYITRHQMISHRGEAIFVERVGYGGAIARLKLLNVLQEQCRNADVRLSFGARLETLPAADLVVGADGVNSIVRRQIESELGVTTFQLTNRLAWYGTKKHFPYPLLSFKQNRFGHFVAAAYPYSDSMSTFVAECDGTTWISAGLDAMTDEERQAVAEEVFAEELQGEPLINNNSNWRTLPVIRCAHWYAGNNVLLGDALHSAHPSIGSGTRIAMEDSIGLADSLTEFPDDLQAALGHFERTRRPMKQRLVDAAEKSFNWYEIFPDKMDQLAPVDFVFDFMMRTGRVSRARLLAEFPEFMSRYEHRRTVGARTASDLAGSHA
jgi:2-polyprenyl-6-methoxyphenol hydroxylase-like FAD-dependent oxidoreductase